MKTYHRRIRKYKSNRYRIAISVILITILSVVMIFSFVKHFSDKKPVQKQTVTQTQTKSQISQTEEEIETETETNTETESASEVVEEDPEDEIIIIDPDEPLKPEIVNLKPSEGTGGLSELKFFTAFLSQTDSKLLYTTIERADTKNKLTETTELFNVAVTHFKSFIDPSNTLNTAEAHYLAKRFYIIYSAYMDVLNYALGTYNKLFSQSNTVNYTEKIVDLLQMFTKKK